LFDLKGALESVVPKLSVRRKIFRPRAFGRYLLGRQNDRVRRATFVRKSERAGPVFVAELHADLLLRDELQRKFSELDKFPAVTRDIAMIVPEEIPHEKISRAIQEPREPLLESVELFDLFTDKVGETRKSLAYRLTYRDRSRTLTNEEVNAAHAKIRERLRSDLGAELRE
jgi:phenylalanyl-tRNA synthetase beta chain